MTRSSSFLVASLLSVACWPALAQTVTPLHGQSQQTIQADMSACQSQASSYANPSSSSSSAPGGERIKGAAAGAAAGAVVGQARSNDYDRIGDEAQQEYRQERAKEGAAAGVVVGGSRQRQERREGRRADQQNAANASSVYATCMQQRGYQVTP